MRSVVSFTPPLERFFRQSKAVRQVPFAAALALTSIAQDVKKQADSDLGRNLDRPTPFTQRAYGVSRATKTHLVATVYARQIQSKYLAKQEEGGPRHPKGRAILVPAGTRLNKYGNMPKSQIRRLLARKDVFSGEVNGTAGIWRRMKGGSLKLLVAYRSRVEYAPRLGFLDGARAVARQNHERRFREALNRALATAR